MMKKVYLLATLSLLVPITLPAAEPASPTPDQKVLNILYEIEQAHVRKKKLSYIKQLGNSSIATLKTPFQTLSAVIKLAIELKDESLSIQLAYSRVLYHLTLKTFLQQVKKELWVAQEEKQKVIDQIQTLLTQIPTKDEYSDIVNTMNAIILFIQEIPTQKEEKEKMGSLIQLLEALFNKKTLSAQLIKSMLEDKEEGKKSPQPVTHLVIIELIKKHYLAHPGEEAFASIETLLKNTTLSPITRYQLQKVVLSLPRLLVYNEQLEEATAYTNRLIPLLPNLTNPALQHYLNHNDDSLFKGLVIEWNLLQPYLSLLLSVDPKKIDDPTSPYLQEWLSKYELVGWYQGIRPYITQEILQRVKSMGSQSASLLQEAYLIAESEIIFTSDTKEEKPSSKKESPSKNSLGKKISSILNPKAFFILLSNTLKHPFFHPPYIWFFTLFLFFIILLLSLLLLRAKKRKNESSHH